MLLQFYNIPAISVSNEPYFASESDRNIKLGQYRVYSTVFAYYPPMYKNRIKFDTSLLSLSHTFNYLSITVHSKTWYYFVDSIEYCNEKIYYINIVMDTVQTFYFDINFKRFEKTRKLSFTGLRDNLSLDSTLYPVDFIDYDEDKPYLIVVQYVENLAFSDCHIVKGYSNGQMEWVQSNFGWNGYRQNLIIKNADQNFTDGLKTMYIPVPVKDDDYIHITNPYGTIINVPMNRIQTFLTINALANDPNVVNMYVTKIFPTAIAYANFYIGQTLCHGYMLDDTCQLFTNYMVKTGYSYSTSDGWLVHYVQRRYYGSFTTPKRAMCDSNYYQISIGELNDYAIVPIELLEPETSYRLMCTLDICSGARTYEVDAEPLQKLKFKHICNSLETMQLFNDNYNLYLLQNKGTLTTGVALQKTLTWTNFANQVFNQNAAKSFNGAMQGGTAGGIVAGAEATVTSGVDLFTSLYSIYKTVQANKENAYYSPDTIKAGNNFTNDLIHNLIDRIVLITKVADCDEIEYEREYKGYLCHDITYGQTLSDLIVTSGSVNDKYLIMGDCELYLSSFNTANHIADIKNRFKSGVRFYINMSDIGE